MEKEVAGVRFGSRGPTITHLLFVDECVVFLEASPGNLEALKRVLEKYEESWGQKVNMQKSFIFFSKGCREEIRTELKDTIGIQCEALSEQYLGLPMVLERSKNGAFKYITDRSRGKVTGWKGQGLPMAEKEILVKSVLQAVGTYPMGCFQLTKGQCGELIAVASRFWWGDSENKRKLHWISWQRMCTTKCSGSMGFRDYGDFNQALLAKQAWRMATNPSSLCSRVLKARYFIDGDFMSARCPKKSSFTWKSILYGRELLKEGVVCRIGSGEKIKVLDDNWIPRSYHMRPLGVKPNQTVNTVNDFLLDNGEGWDAEKLNECFFEVDVNDTLKIHVGRAGSDDYMAWNYTKNGVFSVRSVYHLKQKLKRSVADNTESSLSTTEHQGWLALWEADVASKIKVHCWGLAKNGLAVGSELSRRKVKEGVRCIACNREETLLHRFWHCPHSVQVWNCCVLPPSVLWRHHRWTCDRIVSCRPGSWTGSTLFRQRTWLW
jgi:hypothetical protein